MRLLRFVHGTLSKALVFRHHIGYYASYVIPSHFNYIYRVDTLTGRVVNDYCTRKNLRESHFYWICAWNRTTCRQHKFFLSGALLVQAIGDEQWVNASSRDIIKLLCDLYDKPCHNGIDSGILALVIEDCDVSSDFEDMRSTLAVPNNITASALVLLHKYMTQEHNTTTSSLHDFAVDLLIEELNAPIDGLQLQQDAREWIGSQFMVTVIDYNLEERTCKGEEFLFKST